MEKEGEFEVRVMKELGRYGGWKGRKRRGEFEVKSFEVKGKGVEGVEKLGGGMCGMIEK